MTLALRTLVGLVAGFLVGIGIRFGAPSATATVIAILAPVGAIFINLIRVTVIPLVMSIVIASVTSMTSAPEARGFLRPGLRVFAMAVSLLAAAAIVTAAVAIPLFARLPIDQSAAFALGTNVVVPSDSSTGLAQWVVGLVPQNVVKAAADDAIVPLIVFGVLFGVALGHVSDGKREAVLNVVEGVAEAMQRMVAWILELAPIGVFALAVPLGARLGIAAATAVAAYVGLVVLLSVVEAALLLYPLGILAGRMAPSAFVSFCAPAQAIAFASRSSLAALPVMLESAKRAGMPPESSRFVLPLAAAVFHFGSAVAQTTGVLFLARLFGITLNPLQLAALVLTIVVTSFAVPGIPGGSIIAMVPVLAAIHVPIDGIGILLAVDTIPDMFRTTANTTGAMTLTAAVAKRE